MNIVTYNIKRCGSLVKRKKIRSYLTKGGADICFIQETKSCKMNDEVVQSIWGSSDYLWPALDFRGQSGEIFTIWRKGVLEPIISCRGNGYLGLNASWKGKKFYFLNVYSSCILSEKRARWSEILELKGSLGEGEWIFGGDFNSIKNSEERFGRGGHNRLEMKEFGNL
ncbi:unnamed protein product [Lathyrus sativus]|nr:unnamed protein product [Lathyrus sativus]